MRGKIEYFLSKNPQFFMLVLISIICFVLFYVLFQQVSSIPYLREIISAFIATILTVTITTFLLKSQSDSEEAKERNVEILRRKIDSYSIFIDSIIDSMDDDDVTAEEAKSIRKNVYHLSLFSSTDTVDKVVEFVRFHLLDEESDITFIDVVQAFREELKLEASEELLGADLGAVDKLMAVGFANKATFNAIREYIETIKSRVEQSVASQRDHGFSIGETFGQLSGVAFQVESAGGIRHIIQIEYPTEHEIEAVDLLHFISFDDAKPGIAAAIESEAVERNFVRDDDEEESGGREINDESLLTKHHTLKCRIGTEGNLIISGSNAIKAVIADINYIEQKLPALDRKGK